MNSLARHAETWEIYSKRGKFERFVLCSLAHFAVKKINRKGRKGRKEKGTVCPCLRHNIVFTD